MKSIADIKAIREKMQAQIISRDNDDAATETRVVVGMATCGIAAGARPVFNALTDAVANKNLRNVRVTRTGCIGMCKLEPIVEVFVPGQEKVTYVHVDAEKAIKILDQHVLGGKVCTEYLVGDEA